MEFVCGDEFVGDGLPPGRFSSDLSIYGVRARRLQQFARATRLFVDAKTSELISAVISPHTDGDHSSNVILFCFHTVSSSAFW